MVGSSPSSLSSVLVGLLRGEVHVEVCSVFTTAAGVEGTVDVPVLLRFLDDLGGVPISSISFALGDSGSRTSMFSSCLTSTVPSCPNAKVAMFLPDARLLLVDLLLAEIALNILVVSCDIFEVRMGDISAQ